MDGAEPGRLGDPDAGQDIGDVDLSLILPRRRVPLVVGGRSGDLVGVRVAAVAGHLSLERAGRPFGVGHLYHRDRRREDDSLGRQLHVLVATLTIQTLDPHMEG